MGGASTKHKEEDDGQAPRLLDAPVKIQDQEAHDREGLDFMWGTDKVSSGAVQGKSLGWSKREAFLTRARNFAASTHGRARSRSQSIGGVVEVVLLPCCPCSTMGSSCCWW